MAVTIGQSGSDREKSQLHGSAVTTRKPKKPLFLKNTFILLNYLTYLTAYNYLTSITILTGTKYAYKGNWRTDIWQ